jgi:uncharacterized protein (DUF1015 family)
MKTAFHIAKKEYLLDSASFISDKYYISDRENENEDPRAVVSLIKYKGKAQIRIAVSGNFHAEEPSYYTKDPKEWKEKIWIIFNIEEAKEIKEFLEEVLKAVDFV